MGVNETLDSRLDIIHEDIMSRLVVHLDFANSMQLKDIPIFWIEIDPGVYVVLIPGQDFKRLQCQDPCHKGETV